MIIDKVKALKKLIYDFVDNPEEHSLEEMLIMHRKRKEFDDINFLTGDAMKKFRNENQRIAGFIAKNETTVGVERLKIWKPEKYNFNRRNPMCENIQKYA